MKMIFLIISVIIVAGVFAYRLYVKKKSIVNVEETQAEGLKPEIHAANPEETKPERDQPIVHTTKENNFESLRDKAFKVRPDQLGLVLPANQTVVYGVIMDWEMGNATATTVAYLSGDASLYLSSGGGVIGGGKHQSVNRAAKQFMAVAQDFIDETTKTETTILPSSDEVIFYLLTNKGIYRGKEQMKNFENNSSAWIKLFEEGNKVINELHQISQ